MEAGQAILHTLDWRGGLVRPRSWWWSWCETSVASMGGGSGVKVDECRARM